MTTTIGSLVDVMARHLLETDGTFGSGLWTQAEAVYNLSLLDQDFLQATGLVKKAGAVAGVTSQNLYSEPGDSIDVERISYNGRKLYPQSRFELDRQSATWRADTGRNAKRYHRDSLPEKQFEVWPAPNASGSGWTVTNRFGTVRSISGRSYTVIGRFGIVRNISGATNYFVGPATDTPQTLYRGTFRSVRTTSTNFLLFYDVLSSTETTVNDILFTPDAFVRYVMYGALARMWNKEGDARDPSRAMYCWERYLRGVSLARRLVYGDDSAPAQKTRAS